MSVLDWILLLLLAAAGLRCYLRIAPALNLIDHPNERSLHATPTVVGAGVVPMLTLVGVIALNSDLPSAFAVAALMLGLVLIGLWDDRVGIAPGLRLICYVIAGLAVSSMMVNAESAEWLLILVVGVAVAWCINLVNFMDGIDGLVTVHAICIAVTLGLTATFHPSEILADDLVMLCWALIACFAPLMWLNWPPARVFMGDAGAVPLGFFLALLGMLAAVAHVSLGYVWLICMMPLLVDTGTTLLMRSWVGHAPHVAHRDHAYQRLALSAGSTLPVVLGLLAMHLLWLFPLAVTAVITDLFPALLVFLSAIPSVILVVYARGRD